MTARPEVQVTLTVVEGDDKGVSVRLEKPQTILGRKEADLPLRDRKVSHQHAAIEISGQEVSIVDLESRNGVIVNGKKVSRIRLSNLDEIQLGLTKIKVLIVESLDAFKSRNVQPQAAPKRHAAAPDPSGSKRDIASMIDDELKRFSKWDLASEPGVSKEDSGIVRHGYLLEVLEGPDAGKRIRLEKEGTTIGRGKADISFQDSDISRLHATIEIIGKGHVVIRDLGSTNGTYVNRKRVTEARLHNGDKVALGATLLRFVHEE